MPEFVYDPETPFFDILIPTVDTVRFGFIMQKMVEINKPVFFTGDTGSPCLLIASSSSHIVEMILSELCLTHSPSVAGVGKSIITKVVLKSLENTQLWVPITLAFSAQTSSGRTQEILESKLERRKRTVLGAPIGKRICVFVDDVNMPKLDTYGSQPPIELLRYYIPARIE